MSDQAVQLMPEIVDLPNLRAGRQNALTPMEMLSKAVASGADIAVLEKLMVLEERWSANQARKAFDAALADAKAEMPIISKNRTVDFTSAKGRTNYRHEDLGEIARTVDPVLAKHGLSYRHELEQTGSRVTVTCVLSHRDGHCTRTPLSAEHDNSGNKNSIQAVGSTITYLQRYTLKAALGLAASNDDDAKAAGTAPEAFISDDQIERIQQRIVELAVDIPTFLKVLQVERLEDVYADKFGEVMRLLDAKARKVAQS